MSKNLVIVESPAKAKTIEKYLGSDFKVSSSYGHISDLPLKKLGLMWIMILSQNILFQLIKKIS